jgi:hypothetical protein
VFSCGLPPANTETYCFPPAVYVTTGALAAASAGGERQSERPVAESIASMRPSLCPVKTRPPAVAVAPL